MSSNRALVVDARAIAEALGCTARAIRQRATRESWPFYEQACRGGRRRMYPLDQLPTDVRMGLMRPEQPVAAIHDAAAQDRAPRNIPWELLVVAAALVASILAVIQ